jgi:hypothetical protein
VTRLGSEQEPWLAGVAAGTALGRLIARLPGSPVSWISSPAPPSRTRRDARLHELCRLRMCTLLGVPQQPRPDGPVLEDELVRALPSYYDDPRFDQLERDAIAFAEQWVLDPHGVTDADVQALQGHLGASRVVALVLALIVFEATIRLELALLT